MTSKPCDTVDRNCALPEGGNRLKLVVVGSGAYWRLIFAIVAAMSAVPPPVHAQRCDCQVSTQRADECDALLLDALTRGDGIDALHLPWGVPVGPQEAHGDYLLRQAEFVLNYDSDLRTATWAAYRLTADDVATARNRTECFRPDVRLPSEVAATCHDYDEPVYDRGHFVPSDDMERSEAAMINTYTFANISPQYGPFNRVIWKRLEGYVHRWAAVSGTVYVITGAIFERDGTGLGIPMTGRWLCGWANPHGSPCRPRTSRYLCGRPTEASRPWQSYCGISTNPSSDLVWRMGGSAMASVRSTRSRR